MAKKFEIKFPNQAQLKKYLRDTSRKQFEQGSNATCVFGEYFHDLVKGQSCLGYDVDADFSGDEVEVRVNGELIDTVYPDDPQFVQEYIEAFDAAPDGKRETALAVLGATVEVDPETGDPRIVKPNGKVVFPNL